MAFDGIYRDTKILTGLQLLLTDMMKKELIISSSTPFSHNRAPAGCPETTDFVSRIPGSGTVHINIPDPIIVNAYFGFTISIPVSYQGCPAVAPNVYTWSPVFHVPEPSISRYQTPFL